MNFGADKRELSLWILERAKREGGRFLIPEPESSASSDLHDVPLGNIEMWITPRLPSTLGRAMVSMVPTGCAGKLNRLVGTGTELERDLLGALFSEKISFRQKSGAGIVRRDGRKARFRGGDLAVKVASNWQTGIRVKLFFFRNLLRLKVQPPRLERGTF